MSGSVPDIIRVAQITVKFVNHALIVDNVGLPLFLKKLVCSCKLKQFPKLVFGEV